MSLVIAHFQVPLSSSNRLRVPEKASRAPMGATSRRRAGPHCLHASWLGPADRSSVGRRGSRATGQAGTGATYRDRSSPPRCLRPSRIGRETFAMHITSVSVKNYAGRSNPRASHIELVTDRAGGRIRWGSPPGFELEENTLTQKLAILRANYAQTGRADAHHDIIDISIHNDRYTVPG